MIITHKEWQQTKNQFRITSFVFAFKFPHLIEEWFYLSFKLKLSYLPSQSQDGTHNYRYGSRSQKMSTKIGLVHLTAYQLIMGYLMPKFDSFVFTCQ